MKDLNLHQKKVALVTCAEFLTVACCACVGDDEAAKETSLRMAQEGPLWSENRPPTRGEVLDHIEEIARHVIGLVQKAER